MLGSECTTDPAVAGVSLTDGVLLRPGAHNMVSCLSPVRSVSSVVRVLRHLQPALLCVNSLGLIN